MHRSRRHNGGPARTSIVHLRLKSVSPVGWRRRRTVTRGRKGVRKVRKEVAYGDTRDWGPMSRWDRTMLLRIYMRLCWRRRKKSRHNAAGLETGPVMNRCHYVTGQAYWTIVSSTSTVAVIIHHDMYCLRVYSAFKKKNDYVTLTLNLNVILALVKY